MSFRRAVASNVAVQAIGPASAFLTVFVIARLGGPSDQGRFAQVKAVVDLVVAVGCFGFPQGFIYVINKVGASSGAMARWSRLYAAAFVPVALIGSVVAARLGYLGQSGSSSPVSILAATVASALLVLHGLWRGVYLTHDAGIPFAVFTILPAIALFLATSAAMLGGWTGFELLVLVAALATIVVAAIMVRPIVRSEVGARYRDQPWRSLVNNGLHAFIQAVLLTVQPLVAYGLVRLAGGSNSEVGFLSLGLFLVQGLSIPITMVAPLLFARWTSVVDDGLMQRLHALTWPVLGLGAAAGAGLALAASPLIPVVLGRDYLAAVRPVQAMLLSLPLVCHVRVIAPALHARGLPGVNTVAAAARVLSFALATLLLNHLTARFLISAAIAWTVGEMASALWTLAALKYVAAAGTERPVRASP